jgi:hypothetical protein
MRTSVPRGQRALIVVLNAKSSQGRVNPESPWVRPSLGAHRQDPLELSNVTSGCALLSDRVEAICWLERSVRNRLEETGSLEH